MCWDGQWRRVGSGGQQQQQSSNRHWRCSPFNPLVPLRMPALARLPRRATANQRGAAAGRGQGVRTRVRDDSASLHATGGWSAATADHPPTTRRRRRQCPPLTCWRILALLLFSRHLMVPQIWGR